MLTSTLFTEQNDTVTTQVKNATTLVQKRLYTTAHVITQGSFTASFPGTSEPEVLAEMGTVHPARESYAVTNGTFTITANQAESKYYCVFPIYPSDTLAQSEVILDQAGLEHVIPQGTVAFIFGTDYTVNGQAATADDVVACETAQAIITVGSSACRIVEFRVTPLAPTTN